MLIVVVAMQMIRQFVLEFISPLALNHGQHLLAAAAHVWNERRQKTLSVNAKSVSLSSGTDSHVYSLFFY